MTDIPPFPHFGTDAVHVGQEPEQWTSMAVVPPISMATTFKQDGPAQHRGFEYSRSGNPTRNCFEKAVAAIEGAKYALAVSSGLAGTTMICHMLQAGDHVVSMSDVYGGTYRYFNTVLTTYGIKTDFVDARDLSVLEKAITAKTKLVWLETPTNPTLKLVDIKGAADIVHKHPGILMVVDNTFMSSYFQRPLSLGADLVLHSVTKYLNGHADVVMGVIAGNDEDLHNRLKYLQNSIGPVPSPFDCFLANRGLKTLHVRMRQHEINAIAVAEFLESNPRVEEAIYPGLKSHPQHELAKRQCTGFGGMVSFRIKGNMENSSAFLKAVKLFTLAESLGSVESLCELPSVMTHAALGAEQRAKIGVTDTLIRLSVGIEDADDLIEDLDQALKIAVPHV